MNRSDPRDWLSDTDIHYIQNVLLQWGTDNFREFPWRNPEKRWHGLAAEVLLQRTRAKSVVPVYKVFVERFPEPSDLGSASEDEILDVIGTLGLHWRAPLLKKMGAELDRRGSVPESLDELKELPGIGQYAAAAYLSFHAGNRGVLIDANVVRWVCRLLGRDYNGETRRKKWLRNLIDDVTPEKEHRQFNYALLDFAMTICTPRNPKCGQCPVGAEYCNFGSSHLALEN
jgi:A/G-specific adenine glycosylase